MAVTIDDVFIEEFKGNLISLAQQRQSIVRSYTMEVAATGEGYNWDRIGPVTASAKTTRATATPVVDTPFSRRKSIPSTIAVGDIVENAEIVQMLPDPKSAIASEFAYAIARGYDDAVIAAAVGASRDGDGGSVAIPAAQDLGAGTAEMTMDAIYEVAELYLTNNIDPAIPKLWVIGPAQARQLLALNEYNNADYNTLRPLMSGHVVPFMGFNFVVSTRLLAGDGANSSKTFVTTSDAIGLQVNQSMLAEVAKDPSVSFAWRVYAEATFGAVRVEDEKVVVYDLNNVTA